MDCYVTFFFGFSSDGFGSPPLGEGVVFFSGLLDMVEKRSPSSSDDDNSPPNRSTFGLDAGLLSEITFHLKIIILAT